MREEYRVFQIDKQDTVATALQDIPSGERVHIIGNCTEHSIVATTDIPVGHKMALKEIVSGEEILKYGVCIGKAGVYIPRGSWVHIHVMHSVYDERSSHLDVKTGAPSDIRYE